MSRLISIIVPSYNSEASVRNCLESISAQKFRDFEVIVVDGGSKDQTMQIVHAYEQAKKIELRSVSEKDNGVYDAVNKGIRMAQGQWIYVLGTDDRLFAPDTLERMSKHLMNAPRSIVYGNVKVVGDSGWARDGDIHDGPFDISKLLQRNICQQAVFYPADVFRELGYFNDAYKVCADWDFILRCASKYELKYADEIIALFFGGGKSTAGESENFYDDFANNLYNYFGNKVRGSAFKPAAWRFAKAAEAEKRKGNWWKAWKFRRIAKNA